MAARVMQIFRTKTTLGILNLSPAIRVLQLAPNNRVGAPTIADDESERLRRAQPSEYYANTSHSGLRRHFWSVSVALICSVIRCVTTVSCCSMSLIIFLQWSIC